jgi:chemotaxis protein histidine kinase CheA
LSRQQKRVDDTDARQAKLEALYRDAETRAQKAEAQAQQAEAHAQQADAQAQQAEAQAQQAEAQAQQADARAQQAEARVGEAAVEVQRLTLERAEYLHNYLTIANSTIWRVMLPLRTIGTWVKWFVRGSRAWLTLSPGSRPRRIVRNYLIALKGAIRQRPRLKLAIIRALQPFPRVRDRLTRLGLPVGMQNTVAFSTAQVDQSTNRNEFAQLIYQDLLDTRAKIQNRARNS